MIEKIQLPTKDQLQPLVDEALKDLSPEDFINNHLNGIRDVLVEHPNMYKTYGLYWWAIKNLMVRRGLLAGIETDFFAVQYFNYDDPVYLLCAAWAYHIDQIENCKMIASLHSYEVDDELFEYHLEDTDMEALVRN